MGVANSEMPSARITDYLITLIEDNNYFPEDFFWDHERDVLEFDR